MGLASRVRRSIRAQSQPAIGLERQGAAFDYLFVTEDPNTLTEDAVCFLQPNPAPPLFVRLPLSALTGMEWNGAYLFFETQDEAEVMFAEGTKGWGSRIKAVQVETMPAEEFFGLWTRWSVRPTDLGFVDIVASAAGLERQGIEEVGVIAWSPPRLTEDVEPSDKSDPGVDQVDSALREVGSRAVPADVINVSTDIDSRHFVDSPDRFARLFEALQDEPRIMAIGQIGPDDGQVPEEIDQVFQANAQRAYHALPEGSDEFRREFARRMYSLVVWGWSVASALLEERGHRVEVTQEIEHLQRQADELYQNFDPGHLSDAGFYLVDNLRGSTVAGVLEIPAGMAESNSGARAMIQHGEHAVHLGVVFAMAAAGVSEL
jgi:hypothetical protein